MEAYNTGRFFDNTRAPKMAMMLLQSVLTLPSTSRASVSVHSWPDYAGNNSHPNLFSKALVDIIAQKTGTAPHFRVGGTSGDRTTFVHNQTEAIRYQTVPGTQIPENVTVGPAFFEAFNTFESLGPQYTWMVNLASKDVDNAIQEASHDLNVIGSNLESLEIGNEVDSYVSQSVRPTGWQESDFVHEWLNFSRRITQTVLDGNTYDIDPESIWQAAVLAAAVGQDNFTVSNAFKEGIDHDHNIKSVSTHSYMSGYTPATTLQGSFMNRTAVVRNITTFLGPKAWLAKHKPGIPLYLAEANSMTSTNPILVITELEGVFGNALWKVDILMYAMSQNIAQYYVQQGTGFAFDSWQPVPINGTEPRVLPPWYGDVFVADVIGKAANVQVLNMDLESDLWSAYAVYNPGVLAKYVVVNLEEWRTTSSDSRPSQQLKLQLAGNVSSTTISYLTAPGADSTANITWVGQSWECSSKIGVDVVGALNSTVLSAMDGSVTVDLQATEAVLVVLNGGSGGRTTKPL